MTKDLTIIILTFNSSAIIKECLSRLNFDKYKIVVVDNASSDDTLTIIEENFTPHKIYKLKTNIGFGNGNNVALNEVDTEFALVLNPDAIIDEKNIEIVLYEMRQNEKFILAGPVVLDGNSLKQVDYQAKLQEINDDFGGEKNNYYDKIGNAYITRLIVGCTMFFKMKEMKEIGFFDKNIFLFYEDDEICYRVRNKGYQTVTIVSAMAGHLEAGSSKKTLNTSYLREWHYMWSKIYWKKIRQGQIKAKKLAFRRIIFSFFNVLIALIMCNKKNMLRHMAYIHSALYCLFGFSSFNKKRAR